MRAQRVTTAIIVSLGLMVATPASAQSDNKELAKALSGLAKALEAEQQDQAVKRAFETALHREPTESELRRYRVRMHDQHWTEEDVLDDLKGRSDYRRHSQSSSGDVDRVIRRAYDDVLHREPDRDGLRTYRGRMIDDGWTEQDVREALRKSPEFAKRSTESADKIIQRAYQEVLGRDADRNGLLSYRKHVLDDGWDEHDVARALRESPEYRERNAITREQAEQIVRRAYLSVLKREPDSGASGYIQKVLKEHWTEQHVAQELRHSDEYRSKHR